MRGNPFSFKGEADSFVLTTLAVPKSCFRLEREQLLTAAPAVARNDLNFILHRHFKKNQKIKPVVIGLTDSSGLYLFLIFHYI